MAKQSEVSFHEDEITQDNAVSSFFLRERADDWDFMQDLWPCLKECEWSYHPGGTYRAPSPRELEFSSSRALSQYLDQFSIPPIENYLKHTASVGEFCQKQQLEGIQLRKDLLVTLYKRKCKQKGWQSEQHPRKQIDDSSNVKNQCKEQKEVEKVDAAKEAKKSTSSLLNQQKQNDSSVTIFDPGAEIYLRKRGGASKLITAAQKQKRKSNGDGETTTAMGTWVGPQESVELYRQHLNDSNDKRLEETYKKHYREWDFLLSTNHSLLFYGFGSKRELLEDFASQQLEKTGHVLNLDGFHRDISIDEVLDLIVRLFLKGQEPNRDRNLFNASKQQNLFARATAIGKQFGEAGKFPLYLVVHTIDGFATHLAQSALAALVGHSASVDGPRAVRLVASLDRVDVIDSLWDPQAHANFAWLWQETHTYRPFLDEIRHGSLDALQETQTRKRNLNQPKILSATAITSVMKILGQTHTEVLNVLAAMLLSTNSKVSSVSYRDYLNACCAKFVVHGDRVLRQLLTELVDHEIVKLLHNEHGQLDQITIPNHTPEILEHILDFKHGD